MFKRTNRKYYEQYGITKFGLWLGEFKQKPHQELNELFFSGLSKPLMKCFNRQEIPTSLFVIFNAGAVDFVGGYTYYHFLKDSM